MELPQQVLRVYGVVEHFLIECIPVRNLGAIRHTHHQNRQAGFAEKHLIQIFFVWLNIPLCGHFPAAVPEFVPIDEEIFVFGLLPFLQQILKLRRENRCVVQNKIQL